MAVSATAVQQIQLLSESGGLGHSPINSAAEVGSGTAHFKLPYIMPMEQKDDYGAVETLAHISVCLRISTAVAIPKFKTVFTIVNQTHH